MPTLVADARSHTVLNLTVAMRNVAIAVAIRTRGAVVDAIGWLAGKVAANRRRHARVDACKTAPSVAIERASEAIRKLTTVRWLITRSAAQCNALRIGCVAADAGATRAYAIAAALHIVDIDRARSAGGAWRGSGHHNVTHAVVIAHAGAAVAETIAARASRAALDGLDIALTIELAVADVSAIRTDSARGNREAALHQRESIASIAVRHTVALEERSGVCVAALVTVCSAHAWRAIVHRARPANHL